MIAVILAFLSSGMTQEFGQVSPPRLVACYMRTGTLEGSGDITPSGPHRYLLFVLPAQAEGRVPAKDLKIHDPTRMFLGRAVKWIDERSDGGLGVGAGDGPEETILMLAEQEPGEKTQKAYLVNRTDPKSYVLVGACARLGADNDDAAFEEMKKYPDTRS